MVKMPQLFIYLLPFYSFSKVLCSRWELWTKLANLHVKMREERKLENLRSLKVRVVLLDLCE